MHALTSSDVRRLYLESAKHSDIAPLVPTMSMMPVMLMMSVSYLSASFCPDHRWNIGSQVMRNHFTRKRKCDCPNIIWPGFEIIELLDRKDNSLAQTYILYPTLLAGDTNFLNFTFLDRIHFHTFYSLIHHYYRNEYRFYANSQFRESFSSSFSLKSRVSNYYHHQCGYKLIELVVLTKLQ